MDLILHKNDLVPVCGMLTKPMHFVNSASLYIEHRLASGVPIQWFTSYHCLNIVLSGPSTASKRQIPQIGQ